LPLTYGIYSAMMQTSLAYGTTFSGEL
jgi:hypothetical protein